MSIRKRKWTNARGVTKERWVVDYVDQHGHRRLKTFGTKKEADAWNVTAAHEVKHGVHTADSDSVTVAEGFDAWIEDCEANGLERGTIQQRRQHLNLHVKPFIGADKLSRLAMPRVVEFDGMLRDASRSLSMRRKVVTNLKTALAFCQGKGWVAQNVARDFKIRSDKRAEKVKLREGVDYPSRAEVRLLMNSAADGRDRALLITLVLTGLRASEARGLPWSNVDLEKAMIHVRQRADKWGTIGNPKSAAGVRDVPLAPRAVHVLRQWKAACPPSRANLVFPNGAGNVESHSNLRQRFWEPLQVKCGLTVDTGRKTPQGAPLLEGRHGIHKLRHVAASLFIAHLGWTPKRLQEVMGHSSIVMTFDLYGHLLEDRTGDQDAMMRLEAAITAA